MQKYLSLMSALLLCLVPVLAGDGKECEKCEEGKDGGECAMTCSPEDLCAKLDACTAERAKAMEAFKALPAETQTKIHESGAYLMANDPHCQSMTSMMASAGRLYAMASAADKAAGALETPRAKLTAKIACQVNEITAAFNNKPYVAPECCKEGATPDARIMQAAVEEAVKQADAAAAMMGTVEEASKKLTPDQQEKVKAAMEFVSGNCPMFKAMSSSMEVVAMSCMTLGSMAAPTADAKVAAFADLREKCLASASKLMSSCCSGECEDGEDNEGCEGDDKDDMPGECPNKPAKSS